MAPIRRYLRITKYSVLEVRIYLEKPSDAAWLLSSRDPILPRVIEKIRPKVLPKLREEYENSRKKGAKKKKGIKDVISQDDYEVVLFLTDSTTRHSLITKRKQFSRKPPIKSTGTKLTGWLGNNTTDTAIDVEDHDVPVGLLREESDEALKLSDVPEIAIGGQQDEEVTMISSDEEPMQADRRKRASRAGQALESEDITKDEKKKLALNTSYDGFSLYGKILCLIVKRKGPRKSDTASTTAASVTGPQMMESWISTQVNQQADLNDDEV